MAVATGAVGRGAGAWVSRSRGRGAPLRRPAAAGTGISFVARSGISLIATAAMAATIEPDDAEPEGLGGGEAERGVDAFDDVGDERLDSGPELLRDAERG